VPEPWIKAENVVKMQGHERWPAAPSGNKRDETLQTLARKGTKANSFVSTSKMQLQYDKRYFPKMIQRTQAVYQTFMIKCLRDDQDAMGGKVVMVGTVIQRVIADPRIVFDSDKEKFMFACDLDEDVKRAYVGSAEGFMKEDPIERPFFTYRINESAHDVTDGIRKVTIVHFNNGKPDCVPCSVTNISVEFPCRMRSAFNGKPYQILVCECLIELTSRFAGDYEYRPTLLACRDGMDNFCCVRDEREIDELRDLDPMWSFPTIEIPNEGKMKKRKVGEETVAEMVHYTPKFTVYFYMTTSPMQVFIRTFMPILFATVAQSYNIMLDPDRDFESTGEYLGLTISIGLAVIFVLPEITDDSAAFVHSLSSNEVYIMLFFAGLTLSVIQYPRTKWMSVGMMWASLFIPVLSLMRYRHQQAQIVKGSVENLKRGRGSKWIDEQARTNEQAECENPLRQTTNKSGSEVDGTQLVEFFVEGANGKPTVNPMLLDPPDQTGGLFETAKNKIVEEKLYYTMGHLVPSMDRSIRVETKGVQPTRASTSEGKRRLSKYSTPASQTATGTMLSSGKGLSHLQKDSMSEIDAMSQKVEETVADEIVEGHESSSFHPKHKNASIFMSSESIRRPGAFGNLSVSEGPNSPALL